ncbi:hypothetical protein KTE54_26080 [Burkholderia multivorans]|uniref:glycine-rich domain-containing protein n=1 Tax=Burkholderia multivorans TaxID=87883 RepID=UPI001C26E2AA|nr:hypothetical protein [Burkholderia multivorans]MBU9564156.1 hypothetical protein [Burkholderia multivorans]
MATQNDFLPFATGPDANVVDQATYAALGALTTGFLSGTAQSVQVNKVWRQSSIVAAVIAQFIVAQTGQAAVDDGTTATLLANFTKAVNAASKPRVILPDSGSVNAYAAANPVPMTSLPTVSGIVQTISVKTTNTGASTYSPDGLASRPIFGLGGAALQGGEMVANGIATLVSYVGPLLNGGSLCWVLFECIGGAQQVANATQSQHAVPLGQAVGLGWMGGMNVYGPGTYNFTVPANVTKIKYRCWAAGGGGGGSTTNTGCGAGGGGGAYAEGIATVTPGQVIAITVGAGGSGGTNAPTNGGNGGSSSVGSLATCTGGTGGGYSTGGVSNNFGTGGGVTGGAPAFAVGGRNGGVGFSLGASGYVSGAGGGAYGIADTAIVVSGAGLPGYGIAGGGGGASSNAAGGAGAPGRVVIEW